MDKKRGRKDLSMALPAFIFGQKELTKEVKKDANTKSEKERFNKSGQSNKHMD